jgi:hypothetical protein
VSLLDIALPTEGPRRPAARPQSKRVEINPLIWVAAAAVAGVLAWLAGTFFFG